jgi:hypothetical protein
MHSGLSHLRRNHALDNVDRYLSELADSRLRAQAAACAEFTRPADFELPPDLELAIGYQWPIFLAQGCSSYALSRPRLSWPTHDRKVIESLYARNLDLNWALETGNYSECGGVMSLEINTRYIRMALTHLACGDDSWQRTLRFAHRGKWQTLFRYAEGMRTVGERYIGLRLHAGDAIFIPPSIMDQGLRLEYADPSAPVLPAPDWLVDAMSP